METMTMREFLTALGDAIDRAIDPTSIQWRRIAINLVLSPTVVLWCTVAICVMCNQWTVDIFDSAWGAMTFMTFGFFAGACWAISCDADR